MLAARRRPGKLPEGFYAAAEKEADRAMHTAVRKEARPRPRPLSTKTDWSHAKIKIGPRHQASLPRLDRRRPPAAEGRGGSFVEDPAALEREMAIRGKDWSPAVWKSKFYGRRIRPEKQVARAMDRLFHPSDHELRDAFRYFLPAELAA